MLGIQPALLRALQGTPMVSALTEEAKGDFRKRGTHLAAHIHRDREHGSQPGLTSEPDIPERLN